MKDLDFAKIMAYVGMMHLLDVRRLVIELNSNDRYNIFKDTGNKNKLSMSRTSKQKNYYTHHDLTALHIFNKLKRVTDNIKCAYALDIAGDVVRQEWIIRPEEKISTKDLDLSPSMPTKRELRRMRKSE